MPFLALLGGPIGKLLLVGLLVAGLAAGGAWAIREHDSRVRAEQRAAEQTARLATIQADNARTVAALERQAADAAARAVNLTAIRSAINAASPSSGCAASPAMRAAIAGLRKPAAGNH